MRPSDKVWVVPKGYNSLTGCEIKGKVVVIAQYGGGGSRPVAAPSNMILTEASYCLLQEDGSYLLLDVNN
jgi:hypothetical protein